MFLDPWGRGRKKASVLGSKKQNRTENPEAGQVGDQKKGAAYTQGIYFYTHLYTHLDIVHVKIYAIHTPASCQVPREPAVALVGKGEQMGVC